MGRLRYAMIVSLDGYAHDQSLLFDDEDVYLVYGGGVIDLRRLRRDDDGTFAWDGPATRLVEDADVVWDVCVNVFNRYNGDYTDEMRPFVEFMAKNRVVVRLDVDRIRSWDHRKLGMPAMELGGSTAQFVE